jgi:hypothetical protein
MCVAISRPNRGSLSLRSGKWEGKGGTLGSTCADERSIASRPTEKARHVGKSFILYGW